MKRRDDGKECIKKTAIGDFQVNLIGREYHALSVLDHPNVLKMIDSLSKGASGAKKKQLHFFTIMKQAI